MQSTIPGDTDYKNQPLKEISCDLEEMIKYSQDIIKKNENEILKINNPIDLGGIFLEIINFAKKLKEASKDEFKRLKKGKPSFYYGKMLVDMGRDALILDRKIANIWHNGIYEMRYLDDSIESELYKELRNYILSMIDLNSIGNEILNRFFKDDKPLYREGKSKSVFLDFVIGISKMLIK